MAQKKQAARKSTATGQRPSAPKKAAGKKPVKKAVAKKIAPKKAAAKAAAKPVKKTGAKPPTAKKATPKKPAPKKAALKKAVIKKTPVKASEERKKVEGAVDKKTDRLHGLKKDLLQKKAGIIREAKEEIAKYISGETRQLVDTAIDEGDWAVVDISEEINLMRLEVHRKMMRDIDEVLRKMNEGTYGTCEDCGEEISERRLKVLPTASLCISCQENKEQMEAFSREDAD